jgi:hypothetical protein
MLFTNTVCLSVIFIFNRKELVKSMHTVNDKKEDTARTTSNRIEAEANCRRDTKRSKGHCKLQDKS